MKDNPKDNPFAGLESALGEFVDGLNRLGPTLTTQEALGWLMNGDQARAADAVRRLPKDQIPRVLDTLKTLTEMVALKTLTEMVEGDGSP